MIVFRGVKVVSDTVLGWLLGLASTVALAVFGYVWNLGSRVTVLETETKSFKEWLLRVETKLDDVLVKHV